MADIVTNPTLTLPASEQLLAGGTLSVTGINYTDTIAAGNAGAMFLGITDTAGTLSAVNTQGVVPGSGTNALTFSGSYDDVRAALQSLRYVAGSSVGSDTISFDLWDQYGIETTGTIPVTIAMSNPPNETWTGAVSGDWNTPGNWSGGAVPVSGDTVSIPGGTPNNATLANATLSGETITVSGSATVNFTSVTLDSALLSVGGFDTINIGGSLVVGTNGSLETEDNGDFHITTNGTPVPIVNNGTIGAFSGFMTFDNGGGTLGATVTLTNNGLITAAGGGISLDFAPPPAGTSIPETLINAGSISISDGGGLTLNGTFTGNNIVFNGAGSLAVQQPSAFANSVQIAGFGPGDHIDLYSSANDGPFGFENGMLTSGTASAIPLIGTYGLGNFEAEEIGEQGHPQIIAYAPDNGPSGIVQPDIVAPATASVAQGQTLTPDVSIANAGTASEILEIDANSGALFMNGATGSGTSHLSLGATAPDQINADLASLAYVPAAGATSDIITIHATPPAPVTSFRQIPVTITGGGPTLTEPASETVASGGTVAVPGTYADDFAQQNPGQLFLGIHDSNGLLTATDASGTPVPGSGTSSIGISTDYVDLNAILASLSYTAGGTGTDAITFDVWNQAGVETVGSTSVMVNGPAVSLADFTGAISPTGTTALPVLGAASGFEGMTAQPIGMPLWTGH